MKTVTYIAVGMLAALSLAIGLTTKFPTEVRRVLSEQDFGAPSPFPTRIPGSADPQINAKHAILLDAETFYPLYVADAYTAVPIASTTKMMTALVVLERYKLDDVVTISRAAVAQIGSDAALLADEQLTVQSLLHSLLIQSGNDAAYALAEHGGSIETFIAWMNQKATAIGMRSTVFKDPAGLDDEGRSTAFDLAVLGATFLKERTLREIVQIPETTITSIDGKVTHQLKNSNRLVTEEMYFPGILGLKTGFTPAAGHTLVAAAQRDGHTLLSVVLFTFEDTKEASARESSKLLSWGFDHHRWELP